MHGFTWSIGLSLGAGGTIGGVIWNGPAYRAGLVKGGKLIAVNGLSYEDSDDMAAAIKLAGTSKEPIELLVQNDREFRTVQIPYHDGLRYPHLVRDPGKPALLDDLLAPLK